MNNLPRPLGTAPAAPFGLELDETTARITAVVQLARYHGVELDPEALRLTEGTALPAPATLVEWLKEAGLWAQGSKITFRHLLGVDEPAPILLLLNDGGAALAVGRDRERQVVLLRDPLGLPDDPPMAVDELRLRRSWNGEVLLVRAAREGEEERPFNLAMLTRLVWSDWRVLRDIAIGSIAITVLSVVPILLVMRTISTVLQYKSTNTLALVIVILVLCVAFDLLLRFGRKLLEVVLAAKLDAKLNLLIFERLVSLPIEFFERQQAGQTAYQIGQVHHVREFLTGKLMNTFIDVFMVALLLPLLFYMNATLAWTILIAAGLIAMIIALFLRPLGIMTSKVVAAEAAKGSVLVETIYGIRTIKSLALEPARSAHWDRKVANTAEAFMAAGRLSNWPESLSLPLQRYCQYGALTLGAYLALTSNNPIDIGAITGYMLLGGRVAGPLVSLATVMEDVQRARAAVAHVGDVLNRPNEKRALTQGLRPRFEGGIEFTDITFRYEGTKSPALDKINFKIPAGTMLGLVGRSGSGKSTVTRLLQGINRDYSGTIRVDGTDLREINLRHLRRNFGMVLQDNFLFRGTVRDNILVGRPGLSFEDAVQAARLAGAEEFIERLPNGYDTFIQEGSPNLSGGQKQRLAIARALVADPPVLILDEATSALDPESEALVNANLLRIAKGRTMVIVSHRLSSLLDCDLIMVLEQGRTVDIGPHRELVERCAIYRHLWFQQNRHLNPQGNSHAQKPVLTPGE
jgi:ABC-type bacteriocin/lantibiotic exporter with double-glycine peptidase domain